MTETRFEEIVSQYLDRECSRSRVRQLRRILRRDSTYRRRFDEACRYHYAEKVAFNPASRKQVAQEIAALRAEVLRSPGLSSTSRVGKDRYRVLPFPPSALAAMAAAIVGMIVLGQGILSSGSAQQGFSGLKNPFSALQNRIVQVRMEASSPESGEAFNPGLSPIAGSLSARLHLSGLSHSSAFVLEETAETTDWESLFQSAAEVKSKKRLVLVVPRNAIPDAELIRDPSTAISHGPISSQWGGYSSLRSTTILSLTDSSTY